MDEADRAGVREDLERFAAGGEATPEVMAVIRRARGQAVAEPAFSPRETFREQVERIRRESDERLKSVSGEFDSAGRVVATSRRDQNNRIVLTKGTEESPFRVTSFDGDEPTGHRDYSSLTDAAKEFVGHDIQQRAAFSPREPRIYGERREAAPYTPEQRQTLENIGIAETPVSLGQRLRDAATVEAAKGAAKSVTRAVIDPYIGLKDLSERAYKMGRLANDSSGALKAFLEHGKIEFDPGAGYTAKKDTGGVIWEVMMPLRDPATGKSEANRFIRWQAGGRAEMLRAEGRENLISKQDELNLKSLAKGTLDFDYTKRDGTTTRSREEAFRDTQAKYNEYNKNALELAYKAGNIDKVLYDKLTANPWYVSFLRVNETDGSITLPNAREGLAKQSIIKKLSGGSEKLSADLWGNTFTTWGRMIDGAMKNKTAREILGMMEEAQVGRKISEQDYNNLTNAEKQATTWVMEDGKRQYYQVDDAGMLKALEGFRAANWGGPVMDFLSGFRKVFQYGIMANPVAQATVLIKDQLHTPAVTKVGFNIPKNFASGVGGLDIRTPIENLARAVFGQQLKRQVLSGDELRLLAGGGLMSRSTGTDTGTAPTRASAYLNTPAGLDKVIGYVSRLDAAYQQVATVGEGISRMAVYKEMKKQGVPDWVAVFEAKDVQDYSLRPGNPFVRAWVSLLPFANVHNIGLYKLARPSSPAALATVFAAMTALKVANDWFYKDDEEFQKRPELEHNSNFWFKIGGVGFNIPTGFEVGALAAMSANFIGTLFDKEMTVGRAAKNAGKIAWDQLAMNPIPQPVRPVADVLLNRRSTGGPIENTGDQRLDADQRYGINNTLAARGLSGMFTALGIGLSPKQIDYMVNGYGGWLAVQSLGLADSAMRSFTDEPVRPDKDFWASVSGGRIRTETPAQSRYVDMLYQQGETIEHAYNTYKELLARGRTADASEYLKDNREEIGKYRQFSAVKDAEGKLNRQIRMVENSQDLSGEQKKLQINRLNAIKNDAARSVFVSRP